MTVAVAMAAKVVTHYDPKPIPDFRFDWTAYRDGYEGPDGDGVGGDPIGYGATEAEALADLHEIEADRFGCPHGVHTDDPCEECGREHGQFGVGA